MTIQLVDHSIKWPVGILEDVLALVGKFIILCEFIMIDMDDSSQVLIILGRSFLAIARTGVDVAAGRTSYHLCREQIDFHFPPPISLPLPAPLAPVAPVPSLIFEVIVGIRVFEGDGVPNLGYSIPYDLPPPFLTHFGGATFHPGEVVDTSSFTTSVLPPPSFLPSFTAEVMVKLGTLNKHFLGGNPSV